MSVLWTTILLAFDGMTSSYGLFLVISRYFGYCHTHLIIRRVAKMRIGHTAAVWLGTPQLLLLSALCVTEIDWLFPKKVF